ncbi:hypothetical protein JCGZ_11906 [Jatropha curcas]|uniref:Uncharacterized protein n=1 Tax=Jatropha curcas TaxID=180498 RepID=A0A067KF70_JATCU|nr:hypothetical protein JCGZ_11906 [Jatropha curcas]
MDGHFIHLSEHSSLCLSIKPFEHHGKTYPCLEIFTDVIDILAVEPRGAKLEKEKKEEEKEKEQEEEGIEGPKAIEEEYKKEERVAQEIGEENKKATAKEENEDPVDQVLKASRACIEESFKEVESPS